MSLRASTGLAALAGVLAVTCAASATTTVLAQPKTSVPDHVAATHPMPPQQPVVPQQDQVRIVYPDHPAVVTPAVAVVSDDHIPAVLLDAYRRAAGRVPSCNLKWQVLAGIGKVESNHARGGQVDAHGTALQPIIGPEVADGEHAVGPMQFLPSTWAKWGVDGNGDGIADPENVYDATASAADYLCADGRNLAVNADLVDAVLSYNHDGAYLGDVLQWITTYEGGVTATPAPPTAPVVAVAAPPTTTTTRPTTTTTAPPPPPTTTTTSPPNVVGAVVGGLLTTVGGLLGHK